MDMGVLGTLVRRTPTSIVKGPFIRPILTVAHIAYVMLAAALRVPLNSRSENLPISEYTYKSPQNKVSICLYVPI